MEIHGAPFAATSHVSGAGTLSTAKPSAGGGLAGLFAAIMNELRAVSESVGTEGAGTKAAAYGNATDDAPNLPEDLGDLLERLSALVKPAQATTDCAEAVEELDEVDAEVMDNLRQLLEQLSAMLQPVGPKPVDEAGEALEGAMEMSALPAGGWRAQALVQRWLARLNGEARAPAEEGGAVALNEVRDGLGRIIEELHGGTPQPQASSNTIATCSGSATATTVEEGNLGGLPPGSERLLPASVFDVSDAASTERESAAKTASGAVDRSDTRGTASADDQAYGGRFVLLAENAPVGRSALTGNGVPSELMVLNATGQNLANDVVRCVRYVIREDSRTVTLRLVPESLGEIRVEVLSQDDRVHVQLRVESEAVRHALSGDLQALRDALARDGIDVGRVTVAADAHGVQTGLGRMSDAPSGSLPDAPRAVSSSENNVPGLAPSEAAPDEPASPRRGRLDVLV
ncbi:MAG TPA: flagellar hook-length control protein FliK [Candidatus Hydrogenedentes bacterium]|nr:flagellar hook-length control protein FliK [Candidatus Hydrogenedentota bacterium]